MGPGSQSCALDPAALAEASGAVRRAVAAGADLVLINKFSKAEKAGHGLAAEMLAVMAEGIPLLTAVPDEALVEWTGFTGGGATLLAPDIQALRRWWAGAAERRDAAGHP
ncbi:MAG: DUF2478 domain-containing protein [Magnetospirillum sp.]|nr:DUF2478 domain-containing protein [Magnetospirillum sp.]